MAFPSPPWHLRGHLWGSLFRAQPPGEQAGVFAVAFVEYRPGGTLDYSELLVARRADEGGLALRVRDLWVDSEVSREGGRALWDLPKELATFSHAPGGLGPVDRTFWSAAAGDGQLATAEFLDTSVLALRGPVRGSTSQPTLSAGTRVATVQGSARGVPCLAHWSFDARGPLGWLAGRHPFLSFRLRDFAVTFE